MVVPLQPDFSLTVSEKLILPNPSLLSQKWDDVMFPVKETFQVVVFVFLTPTVNISDT